MIGMIKSVIITSGNQNNAFSNPSLPFLAC